MRKLSLVAALTALLLAPGAFAADKAKPASDEAKPEATLVQPHSAQSSGSVSVEGKRIDYKAVAGTLVLHEHGDDSDEPTVSMFYAAYFKQGADPAKRPITFIYNGGPGSATVWLHMGAFGPRRVVTSDDSHTPAAPYGLVNNDYSLLDASDLVFIDAPGAGFSRLIADEKDKAKRDEQMDKRKKAIYGVDGDGHAFAQFVTRFLSRYDRWNSPKYLFGESYGTTRSAVLANILENDDSVDLNGVILLSQILSFDTSIDGPEFNPGVDMPYALALPTFAATAYYHHKLPQPPAQLEPFLHEVEQYALGEYASALMQGARLDDARKRAVAEKLHQYTGLPVDYLLKANLRVTGGMFEHELQFDGGLTTGRLDSRFSGPAIDPLAKDSEYDPQSSAISSAYVAVFNDYVRRQLKFGDGMRYRLYADIDHWDFSHKAPGAHGEALQQSTNVMPDLAMAMKTNPELKVFLNGGYYDLATPYFAAQYEMNHLPIPATLEKNISYAWYPSGHMVYAHEDSLKKLHDNVARFIEQTDNVK
ncbi:S10 family peptidase [Frateuria terrea]|uniref:Carboxypeptidase C (Cathepsin A) n=1 Tax=Frateuria terrea TaxID=529704 RepID=A0A1H6SYP1_9GAMM|nr:peptidase S10 [Frateuria terrea]SEI69130.1 Carboxypeptidase C (cathepsin A) [Frateuria terrea]SFP27432.1 Carboxypeptidase C (cathepsin A) [Frateuria terrea]